VAKLNPVTTEVTPSDAAGTFLNTLWRQGNAKASQSGLGQFFGGLTSTQERVKSLEFADRLIDAAQLTTSLGEQKKDAKFLSQLIGLGGAYAALGAERNGSEDPKLFINTLWEGQDIGRGAIQLEQFLRNTSSPQDLLNFGRKVLLAINQLPPARLEFRQTSFSDQLIYWSALYVASKENRLNEEKVVDPGAFFRYVWEANDAQDIKEASSVFNEFFTEVLNQNTDIEPEVRTSSLSTLSDENSNLVSFLNESNNNKSLDGSTIYYARLFTPTKTLRIPVLIPKRGGLIAPALRIVGAVAGAIGEVLLDAQPVANDEIFSSQANLLRRGRPDEEGCVKGNIFPRAGGSAYGNAYATHVAGTIFDYGVLDSRGRWNQFDGLVNGTLNFVIEAKRNYRSSFYNNGGQYRERKLQDFEVQRVQGQIVADDCGLVHGWFFNNEDIAQIVYDRWKNTSTLVYYEAYSN